MASLRPQRQAGLAAIRAIFGESDDEDDVISDSESYDSDTDGMDIDEIHSQQIEDVIEEVINNVMEEDNNIRPAIPIPQRMLVDKNGDTWHEDSPVERRRAAENIFTQLVGPTRDSTKNTIEETWRLFIDDEMLDEIVRLSQIRANEHDIPIHLTKPSLKAYIGILYHRGANNDTKIPITELFSESGPMFYRTAMSRNMFFIWTKCISFDDRITRQERKRTDKFAAIRVFFDEWNSKLRRYFIPSESLTIDEQLVSSRCRSPNRIYNPSKPGKYGELIRWCADANNRYFLMGNPLTKRPEDAEAAQQHKQNNTSKALVMSLTEPFLDQGRNVSGDRFFSSKSVVDELLHRRTTYVGTVMQNKREIPPILHDNHMRPQTSHFVFGGTDKKITQQVYQVNGNRKVFMISSMHHGPSSDEGNKGKSDIQLFYNVTKPGVDVVDEMCKNYTTRFRVLRWPVVHFQNILDVTGINVYIIFKAHFPDWEPVPSRRKRRNFLLKLADELVKDNMMIRIQDPIGLRTAVVESLAQRTGEPNPRTRPLRIGERPVKRRCARCKALGRQTRLCNITKLICTVCTSPVCGIHSTTTGVKCMDC